MDRQEQEEMILSVLRKCFDDELEDVTVIESYGQVVYSLRDGDAFTIEFGDFPGGNDRATIAKKFVNAIGFLGSIPKMAIAMKDPEDD